MIELNRETGEIEKTIDLKDILPRPFTKTTIRQVVRTGRSIGSIKIRWNMMKRTIALLFLGGIKIR